MSRQDWISLLVNWLPFIVLIVVFVALSRGGGRTSNFYEQQIAELKRNNTMLERIAVALEKRNEK
jgi:Trk-type K+ transport system membrane component